MMPQDLVREVPIALLDVGLERRAVLETGVSEPAMLLVSDQTALRVPTASLLAGLLAAPIVGAIDGHAAVPALVRHQLHPITFLLRS